MSYATLADLIARYGEHEITQRTDRTTPGVIDTTVVDAALADADDEINAYLAQRYTLPLASVPTLLVRVAGDVARYRLYDDQATDEVRKRYDDAIRLLRDVGAGKVSLGMPEISQSSFGTADLVAAIDNRPFGRIANGGLR